MEITEEDYGARDGIFSRLCLEEFWNTSQIWRSPEPAFGRCVERSVLVWAPCALLLVCTPPYITFLRRKSYSPTPHTALSYTKMFVSVLLVMASLTDFLWAVVAGSSSVPPVDFIAPIILIVTYIVHMILVKMGLEYGVPNSGLLWVFWLTMLLCGLPQLYTVIISTVNLNAKYPAVMVATFLVQYLSSIVMFISHCCSDVDSSIHSLDKTKNPSPEMWASFPSILTFNWCTNLVWKGWRRPLTTADLWEMLPEDNAASNAALWASTVASWRKGQTSASLHDHCHVLQSSAEDVEDYEVPVLTILFKAFYVSFFVTAIIVVLAESSRFISPYILGLLIRFINDEDQPVWIGYSYAAILFIFCEFFSFMRNAAFKRFFMLNTRIKASVMAAVYRKALRLSASARREFTLGDIVNLMAVDAHRLGAAAQVLSQMWGIPVIFILSFTSLWQRLGPAVLAGIGILIILIPINAVIVSKLKKLQSDQMRFKDKRVKLISEIISGIKVLKFYAWEQSFAKQVEDVRLQEIRMLKQGAFLQSLSAFIWNITPYMVALTTFMTYLLVSDDNVLDVETAFVSIVLFNLMRIPINQLPNLIAQLIQAVVALKRMQKFISASELDPAAVGSDPSKKNTSIFVTGQFSWSSGSETANWKLCDINLEVKTGQLVAVVGSVGAGKSSLLSALLGEMTKEAGYVFINGTVAYVSQQAWLQNATIRENITWGLPFEEHRYHDILRACALQLDIDMLPAGDMTEIGENGINLSGGQKQRIALARATYSNTDVLLLDDPLSAVDAHVGRYIFDHIIGPNGLLRHQTRVLVTHSVTFLPLVDQVIVMNNGRMVEKGSFSQLMAQGDDFATFYLQHMKEEPADSFDEDSYPGDDGMTSLYKPTAEGQCYVPQLSQCNMKEENVSVRTPQKEIIASPIPQDYIQHISESNTDTTTALCSGAEDNTKVTKNYSDKSRELLQESQDCESAKFEHQNKISASMSMLHTNGNNCNGVKGNADENITKKPNEDCEKDEFSSLSLKKMPRVWFDGIKNAKQTEAHKCITYDTVGGRKKTSRHQTNVQLKIIDNAKNMKEKRGTIVQEEKSQTGKVSHRVYLAYGKAMGAAYAILPIVCIALAQGSQGGSNVWLSQWASSSNTNATTGNFGRTAFLSGYGVFGVAQAFFFFVGMLLVMLGCLKAAKVLHKQLLESVIHFPMRFFDTNPSGRIINRFGKEIDILDNVLPGATRATINTFSSVLTALIIIVAATPLIGAFVVPIMCVYYLVQLLYVASSRQLKRIESSLKSPIYSHFGETVQGVSTIRAFRREESFCLASDMKIDNWQKALYTNIVVNRWLGVRLELMGNFITLAASILAVAMRDTLSSGIVGLSITYAINVTNMLSQLVRQTSEMEADVVSVERIRDYIQPLRIEGKETETKLRTTGPKLSPLWPEKGSIVFVNYEARYRPQLDLVLRGITCTFKPAEKIGIVGRTGAGKTSMTLGLFRLIEAAGGHIEIDGIDISKIGLHELRRQLSIIPQEPVLFSGTIRLNLDPFGTHSDDSLWQVLELAHLRDYVRGQPLGLQHTVDEGGANLSVGQRQLVCLARALLRKSRILVLDEATAAIDLETDDIIQATIRSQFAECTVLTIAHRLKTIMDYDRVLVLEKGKVAEFDSPDNLLADQNSIFSSLARDAGIF
ncbi:multidrug resistance-associated protein 1-like isoform X3 [Cherax quadricarinatus]